MFIFLNLGLINFIINVYYGLYVFGGFWLGEVINFNNINDGFVGYFNW